MTGSISRTLYSIALGSLFLACSTGGQAPSEVTATGGGVPAGGEGQAAAGPLDQDLTAVVGNRRLKLLSRSEDYFWEGEESGEVARPAVFKITLVARLKPGERCRFTPSAADRDGIFQPAQVDLSDVVPSAAFTYEPKTWGARTLRLTNDRGLKDAEPVAFIAKVQTGSSGMAPAGNRCPDLGGFSFFESSGWWQELGRTVDRDPVAPDSEELLRGFGSGNLRVDWSTTTAKGGNSSYGIPYNVVPGDHPLAPVTVTKYASESDHGGAPFFAGMSIEGWPAVKGRPPLPGEIKGDHHAFVLQRDEKTGGLMRLFEHYQVASPDGGRTWTSASAAVFDLISGRPRQSGWTSSDAAGLPVLPLLVRYDEVARGEIRHPLRLAISPGLSRNRFVWPARHHAYSGSADKGLPMGARLRLKQQWLEAHRSRFPPAALVVLEALSKYGGIVADLAGGGLWLPGVNDERWTMRDIETLKEVPVAAFEVLDTIASPLRFTGPRRGVVGATSAFRLEYLLKQDANFRAKIYLESSSDNGRTWKIAHGVEIDEGRMGPLTLPFKPPTPGRHRLKLSSARGWVEPPELVLDAVVARPRRRN